MKPRVFLCHSKSDRILIEKIANDLRAAYIDVWYDEWGIPPGHSFRRQITKGMEDSDLFFVYLTPHSAKSYWVQHELDAAFAKQATEGRNLLALFFDADTTRKLLPFDIQALHSPVLDNNEYLRPFSQLVSKAWDSCSERVMIENASKYRTGMLELENEVKTLELTIARANSADVADIGKILQHLERKQFIIDGKPVTLQHLFGIIANALAISSTLGQLEYLITEAIGIKNKRLLQVSEHLISDIVGPLVIQGLVHIQPQHGKLLDDYYYLTELGKKVAATL